jgi:hypothetical protein
MVAMAQTILLKMEIDSAEFSVTPRSGAILQFKILSQIWE